MDNSVVKSSNNKTMLIAAGVGLVALLGGGALMALQPSNRSDQATTTMPSVASTFVAMSSPTASASASAQAVTNSQTTASQLDKDMQALDQKMNKMNSDVQNSQTVPTEPSEK